MNTLLLIISKLLMRSSKFRAIENILYYLVNEDNSGTIRHRPWFRLCRLISCMEPQQALDILRADTRTPVESTSLGIWKTLKQGTDLKNSRDLIKKYNKDNETNKKIPPLPRCSFRIKERHTGLDLVIVSGAQLGFSKYRYTFEMICDHATKLGLELCPPEIAFQLCPNDQKDNHIIVASKPVVVRGRLHLFSIFGHCITMLSITRVHPCRFSHRYQGFIPDGSDIVLDKPPTYHSPCYFDSDNLWVFVRPCEVHWDKHSVDY